jgi:cobalt-zinc-cadmium efflux system outer membrane protein
MRSGLSLSGKMQVSQDIIPDLEDVSELPERPVYKAASIRGRISEFLVTRFVVRRFAAAGGIDMPPADWQQWVSGITHGKELRLLLITLLFTWCLAPQAQGQAPDLARLSLVDADALLAQKNRELQAARRAVETAEAATLSAGQRPNPNLSLTTENINPSRGIGSGTLRDKAVDSTIRLDQLIERGNKRDLRVSTAKKLEAASGEDLADVLRQQRLALRGSYYDLLLAQDRIAISADTAELYRRTLQAADLRLNAGDIASSDVSRIRVDALRAQNDARAAEAERRRAQLALAYMIGAERHADLLRANDAWPAPQAAASADPDEMIERRPDVRAARSRIEAASAARELARSLRTRDVSVGVQYEHFPDNFGNPSNSYGVALSVPLFTRNYYEGEIALAESAFNSATDNLERTRAVARSEIAKALSDVTAAAERLARYQDNLLAEAKKSADSAEFAYKNGAIGVMDLLDARRTLRAIQLDAASAQADYAKALAAWQSGLSAMQ